MRLDFWNNPIVVSAFRVKYRRTGPFSTTSVYLLAMVTLGAILHHYSDGWPVPWARVYFLVMISIQFVLSAIVALAGTASSINAEVVNRTLDFQRIAALSPQQILVGKLLGEPAISYLLAIATVPLSMWCWLLGGVSPDVVILMYVNLATTTLLFGALGLTHRLELPAGKPAGGGGSATLGGTIVGMVFFAQAAMMLIGTGLLSSSREAQAAVGLLTPIVSIYGIATGQPWAHRLPLFGAEIPYLFATPLAQLLMAALLFQMMVRRLRNTANTALSKPLAYAVLGAIDLLAAAILFDPTAMGPGPLTTALSFCLIHLFASLWMILCVTPRRETLLSWVWRYRGRLPQVRDAWAGERSENGLALITLCAIGIASLVLLVWMPGALWGDRAAWWRAGPLISVATLSVALLTLSFGTLYQCFVLISQRGGAVVTVMAAGTLVFVPLIGGEYFDAELLRACSPLSQFVRWYQVASRGPYVPPIPLKLNIAERSPAFGPAGLLNPIPLLLVYGSLVVYAWGSLRRRMRQQIRIVERKLDGMAAGQAALTVPGPTSLSSGNS